MRNVILSIVGTPFFLDKTDNGYWVTKNFEKLSLKFETEEEAYWFIDTFHKGDKSLSPTYIEVERYFKFKAA